jgi:hypothetical protein
VRAIFLSYRRDDAEGEAGRLFDDLTSEFGTDKVFMDVTGIEPGRDFRKVIDQNVASCGVLLAMMGKGWIDAKDDTGRRRLDDPLDFVRLETASALKRDIPVIPVLVHGGRMPRPEQLPEDLRDLAYRNGVELTHARWDSDVQLLIKALRLQVSGERQEAGGGKTEQALDRPSGKSTIPASARAEASGIPSTVPPRPAKKSRRGLVVAAVAAIVIAAGVIGAYEYMKAQEAEVRQAAKEAAAKQAAEDRKAAADKEAARRAAEQEAVEQASARKAAEQEAAGQATARRAAADQAAARKAAAEKAAAEKAAADKAAADQAAGRQAAAEKAAAEQAAARKAAADRAAAEEAAARKTAAEKAVASSRPRLTVKSTDCAALDSARYKVEATGTAYAPAGQTYSFGASVMSEKAGWNARPSCANWSAGQPSDGGNWKVECIHRPNDPPETTWSVTYTFFSPGGQPPPNQIGVGFRAPAPSQVIDLTCH